MKGKRFAVEQIVAIVKEAELGMPVAELIGRVGMGEQTYSSWAWKLTKYDSKQLQDVARKNW